MQIMYVTSVSVLNFDLFFQTNVDKNPAQFQTNFLLQ